MSLMFLMISAHFSSIKNFPDFPSSDDEVSLSFKVTVKIEMYINIYTCFTRTFFSLLQGILNFRFFHFKLCP